MIGAEDARVSLRINPAEDFDAVSAATGAPDVRWDARTGGATFHRACWESLRARTAPRAFARALAAANETAEFFDAASSVRRAARRVAALMREAAGSTVAFTGAGISTSAGIGDYRGPQGKWTEMDLGIDGTSAGAAAAAAAAGAGAGAGAGESGAAAAAPGDLPTAPAAADDGVAYEDLRPTPSHEALAELQRRGSLRHVISQNGDGLHGLSGLPAGALSELHGNVFAEYCDNASCGDSGDSGAQGGEDLVRGYYAPNDAGEVYFEELADYGRTRRRRPRHTEVCAGCGYNHRTLRWCAACGEQLRDTIINFGDDLRERILGAAQGEARGARVMLSLGSTMLVTPANELVSEIGRGEQLRQRRLRQQRAKKKEAKAKKKKKAPKSRAADEAAPGEEEPKEEEEEEAVAGEPVLVVVNRQETDFDDRALVRVFGDIDDFMLALMEELLGAADAAAWYASLGGRRAAYDALRSEAAPVPKPPPSKRKAKAKAAAVGGGTTAAAAAAKKKRR